MELSRTRRRILLYMIYIRHFLAYLRLKTSKVVPRREKCESQVATTRIYWGMPQQNSLLRTRWLGFLFVYFVYYAYQRHKRVHKETVYKN